jgi:CxxC motif-containing protein (DUF1111 family)
VDRRVPGAAIRRRCRRRRTRAAPAIRTTAALSVVRRTPIVPPGIVARGTAEASVEYACARPTAAMPRLPALALAALALTVSAALLPAARAPLARAAASAAGEVDARRQAPFESASALFRQRWVVAPSAFGPWGRGPLSSAEACSDCHEADGRRRPPPPAGAPLRAMLLRLSVAGKPHPVYGDQLQHQGVLGRVPGEGEAFVTWRTSSIVLGDGEVVALRRPEFRLAGLNYGPIGVATRLSPRLAPPLAGLGLLEAVPTAQLEQLAREQRVHGVEGRVNRVPDVQTGARVAGRFGLKAGQPSLRQQIAAAAHADIGLTSALFPAEDCTAAQRECSLFPRATGPELSPEQLDALERYLRLLPPPPRGNRVAPEAAEGAVIFRRAGCDACHVPALRTGTQAGIGQTVHAYTDLMLHDLGEALADGAPEFAAGPREWRTPPLWGLAQTAPGQERSLLHDGRARSVTEAILWHGGQAHASRQAYRRLSAAQRRALAAFVESL